MPLHSHAKDPTDITTPTEKAVYKIHPTKYYATKFPGIKGNLTKRMYLMNMREDNKCQTFPFSVVLSLTVCMHIHTIQEKK